MTTGAEPIRVLIVDDSALVRKLLTAIFARDPELHVVETASDPYDAREKIKAHSPDVITLDVEMPKMDGLTFLRNLMRLRPMPVVMVSSLTERNAEVTMAALELGAIDFVSKPKVGLSDGLEAMAEELCHKVKNAARAQVRTRASALASLRPSAPTRAPAPKRALAIKTTDRLIAIGASTGGTEAIAEILEQFPPDAPGVVIAQHIPEVFSTRFAARLDQSCAVRVSEAKDGEQILLGHAYVAPGGYHLRVTRGGAKYYCQVTQDDPINRHRPSVDALFFSVAAEVGRNATGLILTGMGADGADGLLRMREAGAHTIAQDRESCVVFGMPGEAVRRGAAEEVLALDKIAVRALAVAQK